MQLPRYTRVLQVIGGPLSVITCNNFHEIHNLLMELIISKGNSVALTKVRSWCSDDFTDQELCQVYTNW